jgi:hypothetical protein
MATIVLNDGQKAPVVLGGKVENERLRQLLRSRRAVVGTGSLLLVGGAVTIAAMGRREAPPIYCVLLPSKVGMGHVLWIHNHSDKTLADIVILASNPQQGSSARYEIPMLAPQQTEAMGWMECGWCFARDETVAIRIDGQEIYDGTTNELFDAQIAAGIE